MKKGGKTASNKVLPAAGNSKGSASASSGSSAARAKVSPSKTSKVAPVTASKGKSGTGKVTKDAKPSAGGKGKEPAKKVEVEATPPVNPYLGVNGEVTVCYNHYKKPFPVVDGSCSATIIDEEYYLTFAFPKSKLHLSKYGPSDFSYEDQGLTERPLIPENPEGTYIGLEPGATYWVQIEEDAEEKEAYIKRSDEYSKKQAEKRAEEEEREKNGLNSLIVEKREGCSCIEGNPCLDAYGCKDWTNRFEVAKKHGWKGFS